MRDLCRSPRAISPELLKNFDLPLALGGTPFQLAVWRELLTIPWRHDELR